MKKQQLRRLPLKKLRELATEVQSVIRELEEAPMRREIDIAAEHTGKGTPGVPLKVTTPRNPLYDAFLRLTRAALDGPGFFNSSMRTGISLYPVIRRN